MLEKLKVLIGDMADTSKDELLLLLINGAVESVLVYTRRTELPKALENTVVKMAAAAYNRIGSEGTQSYSEGCRSYSFNDELSADVKTVLNRYIKARVI